MVINDSDCQRVYMRKGVDLIGLLGDIKGDWRFGGWKSSSVVQGWSPGIAVWGTWSSKLKLFVNIHIIFALSTSNLGSTKNIGSKRQLL